MSLTTEEKIEAVADRYNPEEICDALELTSQQVLEMFSEVLEERWDRFSDIEMELEEYTEEGC